MNKCITEDQPKIITFFKTNSSLKKRHTKALLLLYSFETAFLFLEIAVL